MRTYHFGETMIDEDSLTHFGVKGMKWGQRKASPGGSGSSGGKPAKKKITTADIKSARNKQDQDWHTLVALDNQVRVAATAKGKSAALKAVEKHAAEMAGDKENTRIASKMTRGEKVAYTALLGPIGLIVVGANAAATREK